MRIAGALKPVSAVDAFGLEIDPRNTWYEEMLISGDKVVVIGYSHERGGGFVRGKVNRWAIGRCRVMPIGL
jgi:hypothetical protein